MKILLVAVNAKYIHSNPAVYSLKAYAQEHLCTEGADGEEADGKEAIAIEIAEYTINMHTEEILSDIYERRPDMAALSCYIWNWRMVREILGELGKILPGVLIWLGGPEVSYDAERILEEFPTVCGIMTGEGEQTFLELAKYYRQARGSNEFEPDRHSIKDKVCIVQGGGSAEDRLGKIPGIVYRKGSETVRTGERCLADMDELPFIYDDLDTFSNRILYYESSRGCPFRCSYCLSSVSRGVRLRDMEKVKEELHFFLEHRVAQVKFVDRTFNCNREHTSAIWEYIHEHDNGITNFHFEIAAEILTEEELDLLSKMRPGLVQLEIGVQSANPDTLREINRHADLDRLRETVGRIREGGNVHIHLDLIAGLPYEDYSCFGRSFNTVYGMKPHQLQLGFLKVLKGSPMYERAGQYGINYTSLPPYEVLYSNWISYRDICRLKRVEEMVELYYNSNQFTHILPVLEQAFAAPFAMYESLADYYAQKGYLKNSPSRVYRYEILLEFACSMDGERRGLYRELLTYDLYLRENMKSRPAFANELADYKGKIRDFYEGEHLYEILPDYVQYQPRQIARMTHMEVFHYPVWEADGKGEMVMLEQPRFVLFDYGRRNPLTKEAGTIIWNLSRPDCCPGGGTLSARRQGTEAGQPGGGCTGGNNSGRMQVNDR